MTPPHNVSGTVVAQPDLSARLSNVEDRLDSMEVSLGSVSGNVQAILALLQKQHK